MPCQLTFDLGRHENLLDHVNLHVACAEPVSRNSDSGCANSLQPRCQLPEFCQYGSRMAV